MIAAHHILRFGFPRLNRSTKKTRFVECNSLCFGQSVSNLIMDRFSGPPKLMLVSDLDLTMVDHDDPSNSALLRFNAMWEAFYRHDSLLVFSTGRSLESYLKLKKQRPLLTPDITITSVGSEIEYREQKYPDPVWKAQLDRKWDRAIVLEETAKFPELNLQRKIQQRDHKVSFFVEKEKAMNIMSTLSERLEERGLEVKLIYSNAWALDVLPRGAGKGNALAYILKKFEHENKTPNNTLVCGDSGNDAELFTVPGVHGVMVSNSHEELLQWHGENAIDNPKIFCATERCAAGIIQAIGKYNLGPSVSPRENIDVNTTEEEELLPAVEIMKFYLFQERWRRAEIENSAQNVQYLKSFFHQSGVLIHPSEGKQSPNKCVNDLITFYGDKKGTLYQIWLDDVSVQQIEPDTWAIKFVKWESSGEEAGGCATEVWLSSRSKKDGKVHGFACMHMHQVWLDYRSTSEPWFF